jgi:uncharacterized Zn-binding protein involved in type VI secretion
MNGAARVHDTISHSLAAVGMLLGAVGGLLLGRTTVTTVIGARVGRFIGRLISSDTGEIVTGSCDVLVDGRHLACAVLDQAKCSGLPLVPFSNHGLQRIATGVTYVFVNRRPVATVTDKIQCGATIVSGSPTVLIGGPHDIYMAIDSEVPPSWDLGMFLAAMVAPGSRVLGLITLLDPDSRRNMLRMLQGARMKYPRDIARIIDTFLAVGPVVTWDIRELPPAIPINLGESISTRAIRAGTSFGGGDRGEAARHAYWMAEITAKYGPNAAREVGIAHELGEEASADSRRDYYNNVLGRQIGLEVMDLPPDQQRAEILRRIGEMMANGELVTAPSALDLGPRCS